MANFEEIEAVLLLDDETPVDSEQHAQDIEVDEVNFLDLINCSETYFSISSDQTIPDNVMSSIKAACGIWTKSLSLKIKTVIKVNWIDLHSDKRLGSAKATDYIEAKNDLILYPLTLANHLLEKETNAKNHHIEVTINNTIKWNLDLNSIPQTDEVDLKSVVMHEIGHGLGFIGTAKFKDESISIGDQSRENKFYVYDTFIFDESSVDLKKIPIDTLKNKLLGGDMFFNGAKANGIKIYTPRSWLQGTSYSHVDEKYKTYLMKPRITFGAQIDKPHSDEINILLDMGW